MASNFLCRWFIRENIHEWCALIISLLVCSFYMSSSFFLITYFLCSTSRLPKLACRTRWFPSTPVWSCLRQRRERKARQTRQGKAKERKARHTHLKRKRYVLHNMNIVISVHSALWHVHPSNIGNFNKIS